MLVNRKCAILLAGLMLSCAPAFAGSTSDNVVKDSVITSKIKSKMVADPDVSALNVNVETNNGVVTLSGNVKTDAEASKAVEIAESTTGVKDVNTSQLTVQESTQPFSDAVITAKVKGKFVQEKLFGDKPVAVTDITVETKEGVVYLSGTVDNRALAKNAVRIAKSVEGVKRVVSTIQHKRG